MSKLENEKVLSAFSPCDIIILSELKTEYKIESPGYVSVRSLVIKGEGARGGVLVLFKNHLWPRVQIRQVLKDQVWFQVDPFSIVFGACYIAPPDSAFFDPAAFSNIQENCVGGQDVLILGDLNARLGDLSSYAARHLYSHTANPDPHVNSNGRQLGNLCKSYSMVPVNHLVCQYVTCDGGLTFRRSGNWISQLDWAIVSATLVNSITDFKILREADLPSDHAPIVLQMNLPTHLPASVLQRAQLLGSDQYESGAGVSRAGRRPIQFHKVNTTAFSELLPDPAALVPKFEDSPADMCTVISEVLYETCSAAREPPSSRTQPSDISRAHDRWSRLLERKDHKGIWNAVNWKGGLSFSSQPVTTPSERDFVEHYSALLNPSSHTESSGLVCPDEGTYCPVLDDPITGDEVCRSIGRLATDKAPGPDGIPPGILKFIPPSWVPLLVCLFNLIFGGCYPVQWYLAKMCNIFKKGDPLNPANYRGISILDALYKVYDSILADRFNLWYKPDVEQAGAQAGRGCQEQLLTLRLLIDIARKSKQTLYILFVDYRTAYDRVNRQLLLDKLSTAGCGLRFLRAITNTLNQTTGLIGGESFLASVGVRQGGLTSCSLFTFYINSTIRKLNELGPDGFLGNLHSLLLMDDTVIFATSRSSMLRKLETLIETCNDLNMQLHPDKSKFMTVHIKDREPLTVQNIAIQHTDSYVYLGSPISNASIHKQVGQHVELKQCHVRKFRSFLGKNSEAPFAVKKAVWDSALNASLLYSCETWMTNSLKPVEQMYQHSLKDLVGIRHQTPSDLVYVETGIPPLPALLVSKQHKFLTKLQAAPHFEGSPVQRAIELARAHASPMGIYIERLLTSRPSTPATALSEVQARIRCATNSRAVTYRAMNPTLEAQTVYRANASPHTYEPHRLAFSRLRLGSHRLRVETGRWSHTPRDQRLCSCGPYVQDEDHVIRCCALTRHVSRFSESDPLPVVLSTSSNLDAPKLCYDVLRALS